MNALPLAGTTAMVTGAGGGIGRGIAFALAAAGANLVLAVRRAETGDVVAGEIAAAGGRAIVVEGDVTRRECVRAGVRAALDDFGALHTVVHNAMSAASSEPMELGAVGPDAVEAVISIGLRTAFFCAQESFEPLRANRGTLILLSSAAGIEGTRVQPLYAAAKAGVRGFAKSLAKEWGPAGVRVNCIAPSAQSSSTESIFAANPRMRDFMIDRTPLGFVGEPARDIGPVAVFLASDAARFMTGQTLVADGGLFTGL